MGSCLAIAIKWPSKFLVLINLSRTLVAFVHDCSTSEWVKFFEFGLLFTRDRRILRVELKHYWINKWYNWKYVICLYFSSFDWQNFRVVGGANNLIVRLDLFGRLDAKKVVAVRARVGKVLPRRKGFSIVDRLLQRPDAWSRWIGHLYINIGHVKFLINETK